MVMSYIIRGKDSRVHVITACECITQSVLNNIKKLGCSEVAVRSSERVPEKQAKILAVEDIQPISVATTSIRSLNSEILCLQ